MPSRRCGCSAPRSALRGVSGWSQDELGTRAGFTARTVHKIERGDLSVGLGAVFEAAALLGVPLFHAERSRLSADLDRIEARSALLPRPARLRPDDEVKDVCR